MDVSLTISRSHNLGQVLETKWNDVASQLKSGKRIKIGIGLPALKGPKYEKFMDNLLSPCNKHDCYFIVQTRDDKPELLNYAQNKIDNEKILHFNEGIEDWFEFMGTLDFMVSTRIHGGMAAIGNEVPTIVLPTDLRILELVNAMKLTHIPFESAIRFKSLEDLMEMAKKDHDAFEVNRRNRLKDYKKMLEGVGLEIDPELEDIIA